MWFLPVLRNGKWPGKVMLCYSLTFSVGLCTRIQKICCPRPTILRDHNGKTRHKDAHKYLLTLGPRVAVMLVSSSLAHCNKTRAHPLSTRTPRFLGALPYCPFPWHADVLADNSSTIYALKPCNLIQKMETWSSYSDKAERSGCR